MNIKCFFLLLSKCADKKKNSLKQETKYSHSLSAKIVQQENKQTKQQQPR